MRETQTHPFISRKGAKEKSKGAKETLTVAQALLNMIEFGMNVQQAIEAPKWLIRAFPASPFPHTMYPGDLSVESRIPESVRT